MLDSLPRAQFYTILHEKENLTLNEEVKSNTCYIFRIRFAKKGEIRYISHHDLMRLWERACRRACLPVSMSKGFNPRPRLRFPMALGLGVTGLNEAVDIRLDEWIRPSEAGEMLSKVLPEGIEIRTVRSIPKHASAGVSHLCYCVKLLPECCLCEADIRSFMDLTEVVVVRKRGDKTRKKDIRPFVRALSLKSRELQMLLDVVPEGTSRPEEIMHALGCEPGRDYLLNQIVRTRVALVSPN